MLQFHAIHLVAWFFLCRVQSDVLPLRIRLWEDFTGNLPADVQSAVLVESSEERDNPTHQMGQDEEYAKGLVHVGQCTCGYDGEKDSCGVCARGTVRKEKAST